MYNISFLEAFRLHQIDKKPVYIKLDRSIIKIRATDSIRDFMRIANETYWISNMKAVRFYTD